MSIYTQMVDAIATAGITCDRDALEYGYSEGFDSIEPIEHIDFTEYVEHARSLGVSNSEYFHSLALAFEERLDQYMERSQRSKDAHANRKVQTHLAAKLAVGLRPTTKTRLFK